VDCVVKTNKKRTIWVAVVALAALYALMILLEQLIPMTSSWAMLLTVLKKGSVYALVAVSMNLLNGFTGLFSLGQAGFMLLGAYTYAIFTIPAASHDAVYQYFDGGIIKFSFQEVINGLFGLSGDAMPGVILGVIIALVLAGIVAAIFAYLIGLPVLRLKSDYLAIATLGFAEILRAICQWDALGPVTNGSNVLKSYIRLNSFKFTVGDVTISLSTLVPVLIASLCILVIVLLINSSYGRAFKAIREDEIAAEAMGINLFKHKQLAFCTSSFFAGVGGALLAMFAGTVQATQFKSAMTYEFLLIVVLGGIGSVTGSCIGSFLFIAASEWWLRFLDNEVLFTSTTSGGRIAFIVIFALVVIGVWLLLMRREKKTTNKLWKKLVASGIGLALLGWLAYFTASGALKMPLLRTGFRLVVFSVIIMCVVLFYRQGIMGTRELPDLFRRKKKPAAVTEGEEGTGNA
jgi:branched-chain amino acid transport system permease protein